MLFQGQLGQSTANPAVLVLTPDAIQGEMFCDVLSMPIPFTSTSIRRKTLCFQLESIVLDVALYAYHIP